MSNKWLCTRPKLLQMCQKSITNSIWFQTRNNTASLDLNANAVNLPQDDGALLPLSTPPISSGYLEHTFFEWRNQSSLFQTLDKNCEKAVSAALPSVLKYDTLTSVKPHGVFNQDLIKSLAKIVQPLDCKHTIHVENRAKTCFQPQKTSCVTNSNVFSSFDSFSVFNDSLTTDSDRCLHMNTTKSAIKTKELYNSDSNGSASGEKDHRKGRDGPTFEQLEAVKQFYIEKVPEFHRKGERVMTADLHHQDLVFENYLLKKPKITKGLSKYVWEVSKLRAKALIRYPSFFLQIQDITLNQKEGCVKMHWRMYSLGHIKFYLNLFGIAKSMYHGGLAVDLHDTYDAISTLHVNKDGKIYLHRVDRRMPIGAIEKNPVKELAKKTAGMVGLTPNTNCSKTKKNTH